jgi:3-hydroxyacyl-CoA dehydrogenase
MLRRAQQYIPAGIADPNPAPYLRRAFESIAMAKVGTSARECIELGYFNPWDVICVNIDQQVKRAKDVCRGLVVGGYKAPGKVVLTAYGEPARAMFRAALYNMQLGGYASEHDATIAMHVANILTGGDRTPGTKMTEQDVLDLECEAFLSLCGTEKTQDRIRQMLTTGKPLRN